MQVVLQEMIILTEEEVIREIAKLSSSSAGVRKIPASKFSISDNHVPRAGELTPTMLSCS